MLRHLANFLTNPKPATRVCCFHFGRCGSTVLGNMLNAHPQLSWKGELFHAYHECKDRVTPFDPYSFLRQEMADSRFRNFGFETKFQHLDFNGVNASLDCFLSQLNEMGFRKFIVLSRRNYLRQAISVARGQLTNTWHVATENAKPTYHPLELDLDCVSLGGKNREVLDCFQFLDQTYQEVSRVLKRLKFDSLDLVYERDLESNPHDGFNRAIDFLELPSAETTVSVRKLETRRISQIVSNYPQVQERLKGTDYEWMCEA